MTRLFAGTEWDRPPKCERCDEQLEACNCPPAAMPQSVKQPSQAQTAKVAIEKRKRGKIMTVVRGLAPADNDLPALLTKLKSECGAGGTLKDEQLEIQGDHSQRIQAILAEIGYRVPNR